MNARNATLTTRAAIDERREALESVLKLLVVTTIVVFLHGTGGPSRYYERIL